MFLDLADITLRSALKKYKVTAKEGFEPMEINIDTIKELIGSIDASSINSLKLETEDFKLSIERGAQISEAAKAVEVSSVSVTVPAAAANQQQAEEICRGTVLKSPIVGTYYSSSSPEKPEFVNVGQQVKKGDTLYIVESMKLMNEIESECDGTVAEIYAQNGQAVEYGQPIMRIE
jgi:acetyl-CoA carboxylase biotin carboxyl carrier protein